MRTFAPSERSAGDTKALGSDPCLRDDSSRDPSTAEADRDFFVVPRHPRRETSCGKASAGAERPQGAGARVAQQVLEPSLEAGPAPTVVTDRTVRQAILIRKALLAGWASVALSAVFLYLSHPIASGGSQENLLLWATWLMAARLCGIASFAIGCVAVYNQRWTQGIALLLLSVVLPVVSILLHGTI